MTQTVNETDFDTEVLGSDMPVLVDFWAEWCMPCRTIAPVVDEIAEDFKERMKVYKLNIEDAASIASRYKIMSIPTLALFKNGEMTEKMVGAVSKEAITEKLEENL